MIKCIIDGSEGFPDQKQKIKVTYANQYVQDSGNYTYQITFPMSFLANRKLFRNVSRFDVKKRLPDYEECQLYVNNRLVISGKGTVTSITQDSVKLQIVGGKSRLKYNANFSKHFIDEIDAYDDVNLVFQSISVWGQFPDGRWSGKISLHRIGTDIDSELIGKTYIGKEDEHGPMCAFNPTWDETNDIVANRIVILNDTAYLWRPAVQPYLMYVLRKVLAYEGFSVRRNDLDIEPWNRLVICSARQGTDIRLALPHWSVYTFIEEVRKLFNASFIFNEVNKTVDIILSHELTTNATATYETVDDFSAEFDEEGMKNIIVSNLKYDLPDSVNRNMYEVIPQTVLKKFRCLSFDSSTEMYRSFNLATKKEKLTTIYQCNQKHYIGITREIDSQTDINLTRVGFFTPLMRDTDNDDYEEFSIVPVATYQDSLGNLYADRIIIDDQTPYDVGVELPSIANEKEADAGLVEGEEDDEYYVTVQDALEEESLIESKEENTDEKMEVMFQMKSLYNTHVPVTMINPDSSADSPYRQYRYPSCHTGADELEITTRNELASMSLHDEGDYQGQHIHSIADFHDTIPVDAHNLITVNIVTDDIPDPTNIYVFRNKKFICQKVEMEVGSNGIEPVKTIYVYEMG